MKVVNEPAQEKPYFSYLQANIKVAFPKNKAQSVLAESSQTNDKSILKQFLSNPVRSSVRSKKFLKYVFRDICKKCYRVGCTFDEASTAPTKMTLNKWMIFCKQFDLIPTISRKKLQDAFNKATQFKSQMNIEQFIIAVEIIERIFHNIYPNQSIDFVKDFLKLSCATAYKLKVNNFSINFPTNLRNSFADASYTDQQKRYQKQKQQIFKQQKRKRQLILIKGMLPQHLYNQICERKSQRRNYFKPQSNNRIQSYSSMKNQFSNVRTQNPQKNSFHSSWVSNYSQKFVSHRKLIRSRTQSINQSHLTNCNQNIIQNPKQQKKQVVDCLQQINSQSSEESDQILKEHFLLQKKQIQYFQTKLKSQTKQKSSNSLNIQDSLTVYKQQFFH